MLILSCVISHSWWRRWSVFKDWWTWGWVLSLGVMLLMYWCDLFPDIVPPANGMPGGANPNVPSFPPRPIHTLPESEKPGMCVCMSVCQFVLYCSNLPYSWYTVVLVSSGTTCTAGPYGTITRLSYHRVSTVSLLVCVVRCKFCCEFFMFIGSFLMHGKLGLGFLVLILWNQNTRVI